MTNETDGGPVGELGARARVKKGVRPYGGRVFEVVERGTYRNGREYIVLDVTSPRTKFGLLGKTSSPRIYDLDEVDLLESPTPAPQEEQA